MSSATSRLNVGNLRFYIKRQHNEKGFYLATPSDGDTAIGFNNMLNKADIKVSSEMERGREIESA